MAITSNDAKPAGDKKSDLDANSALQKKLHLLFDATLDNYRLKAFPKYRLSTLPHKIFSFLGTRDWQALPAVSKRWHRLATAKIALPILANEESIQGQNDSYVLKNTLTREEAEAVFKQTGLEFPIPPGKQVTSGFVGKGGFGEIRVGYALQQKRYVGIKIPRTYQWGTAEAINQELKIHQELRQYNLKHILPVIDECSLGGNSVYQVMELVGLGSTDNLRGHLQTLKDDKFKMQILFCLAEGLLQGLSGLHKIDVYHLDVKPSNLMVAQEGEVELIDLGCAEYSKSGMIGSIPTGDTSYCPPELWDKDSVGSKLDAFTAGLTLLLLWGGVENELKSLREVIDSPYGYNEAGPLIHALSQVHSLKNPNSQSFPALLASLLELNPEKRLSPTQALDHSWFKQMQQASSQWRKETQAYLKEWVQTQRRVERSDNPKAQTEVTLTTSTTSSVTQKPSQNTAQQSSVPQKTFRLGLSPQDLPLPTFTNFVERKVALEALCSQLLNSSPTGPQESKELKDRENGKDLKDIKETKERKETYEKSRLTVCQGMGGVGKTQLASYLIHQPAVEKHYGLRLWFRTSDNPDFVGVQCIVLARELGLVEDEASLDKVLQVLHRYLANYQQRFGKPWLAVFDNAGEPQELNKYFPPSGGHIIITTRSTTWKNTIPLEVMSSKEGQMLVNKLLQKEQREAPTLCETLGYLPLAIVQACAYVRNQSLSIADYLELLQKQNSVLEKSETLFGQKLPSSVFGLWQMTFKTLQQSYPEALSLLKVFSYLAPDNIPAVLLKSLGNPESLAVLERYALVQLNAEGSASLHRLLQLCVRPQNQEAIPLLIQAMKALDKLYEHDPATLSSRQTNVQLLSHGESICASIEKISFRPKELLEPYCKTLSWLGDLQGEIGQHDKKRTLLKKMFDIAEKVYGKEHTVVATILNNLGLAWQALGDPKNAMEYYKRALAIDEHNYGSEHPSIARDLNNLGLAWQGLGDASKAKEYYQRALTIGEKTSGFKHASLAKYLNNLGEVYRELGDPLKAMQFFESALAIDENTYGSEHPNVARDLNNLGLAWQALGEANKAMEYHKRALAIDEKTYGSQHPSVARDFNNLGLAWQALNDPKKAVDYFQQAYLLALKLSSFGSDHPNTNRYKRHLEKALAMLSKINQDSHPSIITSGHNLSETSNVLKSRYK